MTDERRIPRWRSILDLVTTLAMLLASAGIMWQLYARNARMPSRPDIPIPSKPIPISDRPILGATSAQVTIAVFSDFECPFCAKFAQDVLPLLKAKYIDTGRVQVAFFHLPITVLHANAVAAATAAECARRQDAFWEMHDVLFAQTKNLSGEALSRHAQTVRLRMDEFDSCVEEGAPAAVGTDAALAQELGVNSTPVFFLGTRDEIGRLRVATVLRGAQPAPQFENAIEPLLR